MGNRKIRGATKTSSLGITFKSQLEKSLYKVLLEEGFRPQYEPKTFIIWEGFKSVTPFYDKETDKQHEKRDPKSPKLLSLKSPIIQPIRYTPDIFLEYKGIEVWIECKGFENDLFYIKKKMFRKLLDDLFYSTGKRSLYFEIYSKRQLFQAIDIIKNYGQEFNSKTD